MQRAGSVRRRAAVVLVLAVACLGLASCQNAKAGRRCRTTDFGQDATHVLQCKSGRWRRIMTKAQAAHALAAIAAARQTTTTAPPPPPPAPTTTAPPTTTTVPSPPVLPTVPAASVSAGFAHTCAELTTGGVRCWGNGGSGQLGDGFTRNSGRPVTVTGISDATSVTAGASHSCASRSNGQVACWGLDSNGQLGDNAASTTPRTTPVGVANLTDAVAVTAGGGHTCALLVAGRVSCWGYNSTGQLGNDSTSQSTVPVTVSGLTGDTQATIATAVSAGFDHTCALLADQTVACWGNNASGQLGNNAMSTSRVPVAVAGPTGVTSIATGTQQTCATGSGTTWCWGLNSNGQLGDGSTTTRRVATAVTGLTDAAGLGAGTVHTCAATTGGTVACWGYNSNGQLGDGSAVQRTTPVAVSGLTGATSTTAGFAHSCALTSVGGVRCWGANSSGQLGDATLVERHTPVAVTSLG